MRVHGWDDEHNPHRHCCSTMHLIAYPSFNVLIAGKRSRFEMAATLRLSKLISKTLSALFSLLSFNTTSASIVDMSTAGPPPQPEDDGAAPPERIGFGCAAFWVRPGAFGGRLLDMASDLRIVFNFSFQIYLILFSISKTRELLAR